MNLGTVYSCFQALRYGEDSEDADLGVLLFANFVVNVDGIASFFRKR